MTEILLVLLVGAVIIIVPWISENIFNALGDKIHNYRIQKIEDNEPSERKKL